MGEHLDPAPRSGCAITTAVAVLGDRWAIRVLRGIMVGTHRHVRELVAGSEAGITTTILASRLKQRAAAPRQRFTNGQLEYQGPSAMEAVATAERIAGMRVPQHLVVLNRALYCEAQQRRAA